MSTKKKILLAVVAILVIIQFIQPSKNIALPLITEDDISKTYAISEDVHQILIKKCYDCHSNNTAYPWYYNIQPIAWWMAHHIEEGKDELNFSTFKTYPEKKATHKLEELGEAVNEGWMPLDSYLWIHHEAEITEADRTAINAWLKTLPVSAHQ
jgi:hypothetical protein